MRPWLEGIERAGLTIGVFLLGTGLIMAPDAAWDSFDFVTGGSVALAIALTAFVWSAPARSRRND